MNFSPLIAILTSNKTNESVIKCVRLYSSFAFHPIQLSEMALVRIVVIFICQFNIMSLYVFPVKLFAVFLNRKLHFKEIFSYIFLTVFLDFSRFYFVKCNIKFYLLLLVFLNQFFGNQHLLFVCEIIKNKIFVISFSAVKKQLSSQFVIISF